MAAVAVSTVNLHQHHVDSTVNLHQLTHTMLTPCTPARGCSQCMTLAESAFRVRHDEEEAAEDEARQGQQRQGGSKGKRER